MDAVNLRDWVLAALPSHGKPCVVGLAGYPLGGKTYLAHQICKTVGTLGVIIPAESFVHSRKYRADRNLNGCCTEAHDVGGLGLAVSSVSEGKGAILRQYSWTQGAAVGQMTLPREIPEVIVVDGSISGTLPIQKLSDLTLFFRPKIPEQWLELATKRDVEERAWAYEDALRENLSKASTCNEHINNSVAGSSWIVEVNFISNSWNRMSFSDPIGIETHVVDILQ